MRIRGYILLTIAAIILSACTQGAGAPAPAAEARPGERPAGGGTPAASLFPAKDWSIRYAIWEGTTGAVILEGPEAMTPVSADEDLIRDGDRIVVTQNGKVYATWHINQDGVWRRDPKGGGALLRYLPPKLENGLAWKQQSGDAEVWFKLTYGRTGCRMSHNPIECWSLTVLNRGEQITFGFREGTGPEGARALNWNRLADSYQKHEVDHKAGSLTPEQRTAFLKQGEAAPSGPLPAVTAVTPEEFDRVAGAARFAARPGAPVTRVDADGDGPQEWLQGAVGEWTREPVTLFSPDKAFLAEQGTGPSAGFRLQPVTFPGFKQTFFLVQFGRGIELLQYQDGRLARLAGWDRIVPPSGPLPVDSGITIDRVEVKDGVIRVEWVVPNPPSYTRVREYRPVELRGAIFVQPVRTTYLPPANPVYPNTGPSLLAAAFVSYWTPGLEELTARYFASPEAAGSFKPLKPKAELLTHDVTVEFGTVAPATDPDSPPKVTPAKPVPGSPIGFSVWARDGAVSSGLISVWGKVTLADHAGRLLIQSLTIEGERYQPGRE
ncbi:MAG TPA: hypothetical protein VNT75_12300 [Symbiobacteriaceae bacterium]|nr:hypothetical protein [Symbiobacteriaceae bacterium]